MKYQQEQTQKKIKNILSFFKTITKRIVSIILVVVLIIAIIISINFFRYVVIGKSTLSNFKNNFFGIPSNKLLKINQQICDQHDNFKQWFANFKKRLSR